MQINNLCRITKVDGKRNSINPVLSPDLISFGLYEQEDV